MKTDRRARRLATGLVVAAAVVLAAGLAGCGQKKTEAQAEPVYLFSQTCSSVTIEEAGDQVLVTMHEVSPLTLYFSEAPFKITDTLDTKTFVDNWKTYFKDLEPNAALAYVDAGGRGGGLEVGTITKATYSAGEVVYLGTPMKLPQSDRVALGKDPFPSLPATLGASVVVIDSVGLPAGGRASSAGTMYGMACGWWQKTTKSYQRISDAPNYFDDYFQAIAPSTQLVTNYGLLWDDDEAFVKAAKKAGLKVSVCVDPTWSASGPASTNQTQLDKAIALIKDGTADNVVIGNEVLSKFDKAYGYEAWKNDMLGYIRQVKAAKGPTGQSVPVGTSYAAKVYDDAGKSQEEEVNRNCDFVQVTIHPANVARDRRPWGQGNQPITTVDGAIWYLKDQYRQSQEQMVLWGLQSTPLEIRETGWPSKSDFGDDRDTYFTTANAKDYYDQVLQWSSGAGVHVYWFEGVDEPEKDSHMPAFDEPYDLNDFESNWGKFHWTPNDPKDVTKGGTFSQKY